MPDLPPDPDRLREILRWLEERHAETEAVGIYLRLQRDAVREALARAEGEEPPRETEQPAPQPKRSAARPAQPGPLHTFTQRSGGASTGLTLERRAQAVGDERVLIHVDDRPHAVAGKPIDAHDARAAVLAGVEACPFCRPDSELGIDLG
ncbi:DUF6233 domain-containing protein [Streptomyces sp. NPDC055722]